MYICQFRSERVTFGLGRVLFLVVRIDQSVYVIQINVMVFR